MAIQNSRYWPAVDSAVDAAKVMHQGAYAYWVGAAITAVVAGIALAVRHSVAGVDAYAFVDVAMFVLIGWRVYRLSLPWAIAGLVIFVAEKVYQLASLPSGTGVGGAPILAVVLLLYFVHAIRAGLFLRRLGGQSADVRL